MSERTARPLSGPMVSPEIAERLRLGARMGVAGYLMVGYEPAAARRAVIESSAAEIDRQLGEAGLQGLGESMYAVVVAAVDEALARVAGP